MFLGQNTNLNRPKRAAVITITNGEILKIKADIRANKKIKTVNLSFIECLQSSIIVRKIRTQTAKSNTENIFWIIGISVIVVKKEKTKTIDKNAGKQTPIIETIAPNIPFALYPINIETFPATSPGKH